MAHQAGAYPSFRSMKRLGVFLLPPGWDASTSQGYPQQLIHWYPFRHLGGERHYEGKVSCPRTQRSAQTRRAFLKSPENFSYPKTFRGRRAFLKRPENFSYSKTFRGSFRARFSGSRKRFSKRPIFSRDFRGCFRAREVFGSFERQGSNPDHSIRSTARKLSGHVARLQ